MRLNMAEAVSAGITTITDNWGVNNGDDQTRVDECCAATLEAYRERRSAGVIRAHVQRRVSA